MRERRGIEGGEGAAKRCKEGKGRKRESIVVIGVVLCGEIRNGEQRKIDKRGLYREMEIQGKDLEGNSA